MVRPAWRAWRHAWLVGRALARVAVAVTTRTARRALLLWRQRQCVALAGECLLRAAHRLCVQVSWPLRLHHAMRVWVRVVEENVGLEARRSVALWNALRLRRLQCAHWVRSVWVRWRHGSLLAAVRRREMLSRLHGLVLTTAYSRTVARAFVTWNGMRWAVTIARDQVRSGRVRSGQIRSGQVRSGQVRSGQVRSGQVRSGQVRSGTFSTV
jgi:hypothetical protein